MIILLIVVIITAVILNSLIFLNYKNEIKKVWKEIKEEKERH